ncbi:MAG: SUMF1/EgtB/PvdO family nonheme iron enzyme [bacterium]|nr:SUMF1/EgtB/PvdO family nonheme iron enzyme [bacterium]
MDDKDHEGAASQSDSDRPTTPVDGVAGSEGGVDSKTPTEEVSRTHPSPPRNELAQELHREQKAVRMLPGVLVAGRFEIVRQLGFGGMGAVYLVRDHELQGQLRALKVMLPSLIRSPGAQERFISEITISQKLSHDGIVRVHDLGRDKATDVRFFTMEYVEGKTLNREMNENEGRLPVDKAMDYALQLCDALSYAHTQTVHRDLKPQNVMVRPGGRLKVLDFGLAKIVSPGRMTRSSMALGTAYYQAPEQSVQLGYVDARADIYSLGVMMYQMVTGELPVGRFSDPSKLTSGCSRALDNVILRCIENKPDARYQSMEDLSAALRAVMNPAPRKHGLLVGGLVCALVVALCMVGYQAYLSSLDQSLPGGGDDQDERQVNVASVEDPSQGEETEPPEPSLPPKEEVVTPSEPVAPSVQDPVPDPGPPAGPTDQSQATPSPEPVKPAQPQPKPPVPIEPAAQDTTESEDPTPAQDEEREKAAAADRELKQARSAAEEARTKADQADAATLAKNAYGKARDAFVGGVAEEDPATAASAFHNAGRLYNDAAAEARREVSRRIASARTSAETARKRAVEAGSDKHAKSELAKGDALFQQAKGSSDDHQKAVAKYVEAEAQYAKAGDESASRKQSIAAAAEAAQQQAQQEARQGADDARRVAESSKQSVDAAVRMYASAEADEGDSAWKTGLAAIEKKDYDTAVKQFQAADAAYAKAGREAQSRRQVAKRDADSKRQTYETAKSSPAAGRVSADLPTDHAAVRQLADRAASAYTRGDYREAARDFDAAATRLNEASTRLPLPLAPEMVRIAGGSFTMGTDDPDASRDEQPAHRVNVSTFLLCRYETTASQYCQFLNDMARKRIPVRNFIGLGAECTVENSETGYRPRHGCENLPANRVSWLGALEYCKWLSSRSDRSYRLPTEAEWEFAARGTEGRLYPWGNAQPASDFARFDVKGGALITALRSVNGGPAGATPGTGLMNMGGNVWEWCRDAYDRTFYQSGLSDNPCNSSVSATHRVLRGGGADSGAASIRAGKRFAATSQTTVGQYGFRVAADN